MRDIEILSWVPNIFRMAEMKEAALQALVLAGLALGSSGCDRGDIRPRGQSLLSIPDSVPLPEVVSSEATCTGCLSFTRVLEIGSEDGPGYLSRAPSVVRDQRANYVVAQPEGAKVFSYTGEFLFQLGRKGEGPGEFLDATEVFVDSQGRLHIVDRRVGRESIYSSDYDLLSTRQYPALPIDVKPLPHGDRVIANMAIRSADALGLPLHIISDRGVERSFGRTSGTQVLGGSYVLEVDAVNDLIYSASANEYKIRIWDLKGEQVGGFIRRGLWEPAKPGTPPLTEERPPDGFIMGLHVDERGRLWVISWMPEVGWEQRVEEVQMPDGVILLQPLGRDEDAVYQSVVEVIDIRTGSLVAEGRTDHLLLDFVADGLIWGADNTPAGAPKVVIWSLEWTDPS